MFKSFILSFLMLFQVLPVYGNSHIPKLKRKKGVVSNVISQVVGNDPELVRAIETGFIVVSYVGMLTACVAIMNLDPNLRHASLLHKVSSCTPMSSLAVMFLIKIDV